MQAGHREDVTFGSLLFLPKFKVALSCRADLVGGGWASQDKHCTMSCWRSMLLLVLLLSSSKLAIGVGLTLTGRA